MSTLREHPIIILKKRFPQLMLPIKSEISKSDLYKKVVYEGQPVPSDKVDFKYTLSDQDKLSEDHFTCGDITILFLNERKDFISVVQKIAYRCEPIPIPKSMGAITINGLNNWEKVKKYKKITDNNTYKDSLVILSKGFYSGLDASFTPYTQSEWMNTSLFIRKYHELTHYLCRKKYVLLKNALLDEIFADCMGIVMAIGRYDDFLAMQFLGIEKETYKYGMRLENYISDENNLDELYLRARMFIYKFKELAMGISADKDDFEDTINQYYPRAYDLYINTVS